MQIVTIEIPVTADWDVCKETEGLARKAVQQKGYLLNIQEYDHKITLKELVFEFPDKVDARQFAATARRRGLKATLEDMEG